jgi:Domain of unknown function (DUF397)
MEQHDLRHANWFISSYSANGSTCVEIATNLPGVVAVRDSKDPDGLALTFSAAEWRAFIQGAKAGEFDTP